MKKIILAIVLSGLCVVSAVGADTDPQQPRGRHQGPPPEAYEACEGKSEGDKSEFVSPNGDMVTGVCELQGDRLVLRPDNPPPDDRGRGND